eukprot:s534_g16.t1
MAQATSIFAEAAEPRNFLNVGPLTVAATVRQRVAGRADGAGRNQSLELPLAALLAPPKKDCEVVETLPKLSNPGWSEDFQAAQEPKPEHHAQPISFGVNLAADDAEARFGAASQCDPFADIFDLASNLSNVLLRRLPFTSLNPGYGIAPSGLSKHCN